MDLLTLEAFCSNPADHSDRHIQVLFNNLFPPPVNEVDNQIWEVLISACIHVQITVCLVTCAISALIHYIQL